MQTNLEPEAWLPCEFARAAAVREAFHHHAAGFGDARCIQPV